MCLGSAALYGQAQTPAPLTLPDAVAQAWAANPAAQAAQAALTQGRERLAEAQAGQRLQITLNSSVGGSNANVIQPPPSQESFYALQDTITVPLPLGAKPRLAVREAQSQFQASQAQYDAARADLAGQVGTAYFDLLRKQELLLAAQETRDEAQRQADEAQLRFHAGDVAQLDVLRAQAAVLSAQAAVQGAATDVAVSQEALNSLLGRSLDAPLLAAEPPLSPLPTLAQARTDVLAFSPSLRVAAFTVQADQAALDAARRYADPAVSLQAIDTRSNDQTSFSRVDTVQAAVSVPLSDGGLGRAQVREAQAALAEAEAQEAQARQAAFAAVSAAYLAAGSARDQITAAQAALDAAQVAYDKTLEGYKSGLFPLSDALNAQDALRQARIAHAQAISEAAADANALEVARNGGFAPAPSPPASSLGGAATP